VPRFAAFASIGAALGQRNFAWYLAGSTIALTGMWAQRVAIGWLAWELTHSGVWLGLVSFADLFPTVIVTPIAGVIADRVDRRRMSIFALSLAMVQAFTLAALTWFKLIEIWSLLALVVFSGVVFAFNSAARLAMVPNLLERQYVPSALALDSATFNIARFIGPAVAGAMIAFWGVATTFLLNSLTFTVFIYALARARMVRSEIAVRGRDRAGMAGQLAEGARYAAGHPGIGPILVLVIASSMGVRGFMELLPGLTDVVFHRGAVGLAQLNSAAGVGAFITTFWLAQRGHVRGITSAAIYGLATSGLAVLVFAATDIFWIGMFATLVAGGATSLCATGTQTLMQTVVAGAMRGRVMSLYAMFNRGTPAIGALLMGAASEAVGFRTALLGGAALALGVLLWVLRKRRTMTHALEAEPGS
jgi:MFS family permease